MTKVNYNIKFIPRSGSEGTLIRYKKESDSSWTIPVSPANPTTLPVYPLSLEQRSVYYISVSGVGTNCTQKSSISRIVTPSLTPCCPDGFTLAPDQSYCYQEQIQAPEIISSGICLAPSQLSPQYGGSGTHRYAPGYSTRLTGNYTLLETDYWHGSPAGGNNSPMNRDAVWVDTDCDTNKDGLEAGKILQFTYIINTSNPKTYFIGIGGDNTFRVEINGTVIVDCDKTNIAGGGTDATINFTVWHLFPVSLQAGPNYINFKAVGDGSTNDAFGCVIYDNTAAELDAATTDNDLRIVFRTGDFKGTSIDIAACPDGWTLDTTGGAGNYSCHQITVMATIDC